MSFLEPVEGSDVGTRAYTTHKGRDLYVPLSDGSTPGRVRDRGGVQMLPSIAAIDALRSVHGWPEAEDIHPLNVVVVLRGPVDSERPRYSWFMRCCGGAGLKWPFNDTTFDGDAVVEIPNMLYEIPQSVVRKLSACIAQKHSLRHSTLITRYLPWGSQDLPWHSRVSSHGPSPLSVDFPRARRSHSREARLRPRRLLRGTIRALAILAVLQVRAAERVYAPCGRGFCAAKASFQEGVERMPGEKRARAERADAFVGCNLSGHAREKLDQIALGLVL